MEPSYFKLRKKGNFLNYNTQEVRGWIIDEMNSIESEIDKIIIGYFKPENSKMFEMIVLNSSIINIDGKLKILGNIGNFDSKIINKIRELSSIRNAFAHLPITEIFQVKRIKPGDKMTDFEFFGIRSEIDVMNSSGIINKKNPIEEAKKFEKLNKEILAYISKYSLLAIQNLQTSD